jgi:ATP-dependent Clp protease ATP-binding subunit ClpC
LRRAIQRHVEDPISEKILWKEYEAGEVIIVDAEKGADGEEHTTFKKTPRLPDHPPVELAGVAEGDVEARPED